MSANGLIHSPLHDALVLTTCTDDVGVIGTPANVSHVAGVTATLHVDCSLLKTWIVEDIYFAEIAAYREQMQSLGVILKYFTVDCDY